ncbi:MAG: hypothetical protein ACK41W_13455 [Cyanobacteriota bacterium]
MDGIQVTAALATRRAGLAGSLGRGVRVRNLGLRVSFSGVS